MKITIEVKEFKFKAGDIVTYRNRDNDKTATLKVLFSQVDFAGEVKDHIGRIIEVFEYYGCEVMEGSYLNNKTPIPAKAGSYWEMERADLEERAI